MPGVALVGGNEFRDNCEAMDRELLRRCGPTVPRVVILPTAAASYQPRMAIEHGVRHFETLGASATGALVLSRDDANRSEFVDQMGNADLIYLSGGDPYYLLETLRDTALWKAIKTAHAGGAMLAGSSAGAMILGARMRAPGKSWVPALGFVPGIVVIPHFAPERAARADDFQSETAEGLTILGIAEATAAVSDDSSPWTVTGVGSITVISEAHRTTYPSGAVFK